MMSGDDTNPYDLNGEILGGGRMGGGGISKKRVQPKVYKAPKKLDAFPDVKIVKTKNKKRRRWKVSKDRIYEWDSRHGEVEIYDKTGKQHLGSFDSKTGKKLKEGIKGRTVEK